MPPPPDPLTDFLHRLIATALKGEVERAVESALVGALPEAIRRASLPEYMTRAEAAEYARVSPRTLDGWRKRGLQWVQRRGRVVIASRDLIAYLEEARVGSRG